MRIPPVLNPTTAELTVDKNGEAQEVQITLASTGVPADVGVPFGEKHGATLQACSGQVGHHLEGIGGKTMSGLLSLSLQDLKSLAYCLQNRT